MNNTTRFFRPRILPLPVVLIVALANLSACTLFHTGGVSNHAQELRTIRTFSGFNREFGEPFGVAASGTDIFVSDGENSKIFKIAADGIPTVVADGLSTPSGIAVNIDGEILVADTGSQTIRRIHADGATSIVAGIENSIGSADGPAAMAMFNGPIGIAAASDGAIFVADTYNDRIRIIENGAVRTLAGSTRGFADGVGPAARFDTPLGIAVWQGDKLLVADSGNGRIRVVERDGSTWTLSGNGDGQLRDGTLAQAGFDLPAAVTVDQQNNIYVADASVIRVIGRRSFPIVETLSARRRGFSDGTASHSSLNRPSGLAIDQTGSLMIADSENQVIRIATDTEKGSIVSPEQRSALRFSGAEFRHLQPARWPYDPPERVREIAGTLGEVRGQIKPDETDSVWFHNGLDIAGGYGETTRFVRSETVLDPNAVANFGTARELIRMPTLGYIHLRLGRDVNNKPFADGRFQFEFSDVGAPTRLRIPRGTSFQAGEPIGSLNSLNHVHMIAGRVGAEMNALDALMLPGVSDSITPTIERVFLTDENWSEIETENATGRIKLTGKARLIVRAYDRMDGNAERRRLGVYRLGYQTLKDGVQLSDTDWTISFDRMPPNDAVRFVYAPGSRSGYSPDTVFDYIVSNRVNGDGFSEGFVDPERLESGSYTIRIFVADFFGNTATKDVSFEVSK